jgi:hypothetical protein
MVVLEIHKGHQGFWSRDRFKHRRRLFDDRGLGLWPLQNWLEFQRLLNGRVWRGRVPLWRRVCRPRKAQPIQLSKHGVSTYAAPDPERDLGCTQPFGITLFQQIKVAIRPC